MNPFYCMHPKLFSAWMHMFLDRVEVVSNKLIYFHSETGIKVWQYHESVHAFCTMGVPA